MTSTGRPVPRRAHADSAEALFLEVWQDGKQRLDVLEYDLDAKTLRVLRRGPDGKFLIRESGDGLEDEVITGDFDVRWNLTEYGSLEGVFIDLATAFDSRSQQRIESSTRTEG